jgi:hypothetical protein
MKWAYSFRERTKAALLLAGVLALVFMVSLMERRNVSKLGTSFSSVYEDRLVVESYIYKFSDYLYKKKLLADACSQNGQTEQLHKTIGLHNEAIVSMIQNYEKTKLTEEESVLFAAFKKDMYAIMEVEVNLEKSGLNEVKPVFDEKVNNALMHLNHLSAIQLSEGQLLNENSKRIIAGSEVLTQFEMAVLIIIGLLIQVLIFTSKSVQPRMPQVRDLN